MIKQVNYFLEDYDVVVFKERLREHNYTVTGFCKLARISYGHFKKIMRGEYPINEKIKKRMIATRLATEEDFTEEGFVFDY